MNQTNSKYNQLNEIELRDDRSQEIEIDLLELLEYYRKRIVWIICAFLIGAIAAGLITQFAITPKYTATAKMYMVSSSTSSVVDLTDLNIGQSISSDYVELLKTRPIIQDIIQEQDLPYSYSELLSMLSLSVVNDTRIISINVTSTDREEAKAIANALADKGVSELPRLMETPEPHIAEYAIAPANPSSPSLTKNVMLGALLATLLMLGIFTIQFLMDDTLKTADDIEREFGVMPLTVIPEGKIEGVTGEEETPKKKKRGLGRRKKSARYGKSHKKVTK